MEKKKPDDIMAECLLAGGKMLSRSCRACGSPLFEVKGETLCVVCREAGKEAGKVSGKKGAQAGAAERPPAAVNADPAAELRMAVAELARRAREESDPERCLALLEAARKGAEALALLQR